MFDPDYRKSPWNRSQYAPKNSGAKNKAGKGNAMTLASFRHSFVYYFIAFLSLVGIVTAGDLGALFMCLTPFLLLVAMIMQVLKARSIRKEEYNLLTQMNQPVERFDFGYDNTQWDNIKSTYDEHARFRPPQNNTYNPVGQGGGGVSLPPSITNIDLSKLSPEAFEQEVAWILQQRTKHIVSTVGGSGDGGIDLTVRHYLTDELIAIVQCKRYQPGKALPPSYVRELFAVKEKTGAKRAILATTAHFSNSTKDEASYFNIQLMDGKTIRRLHHQLVQKI